MAKNLWKREKRANSVGLCAGIRPLFPWPLAFGRKKAQKFEIQNTGSMVIPTDIYQAGFFALAGLSRIPEY